jgi:hypothetical protein
MRNIEKARDGRDGPEKNLLLDACPDFLPRARTLKRKIKKTALSFRLYRERRDRQVLEDQMKK